MAIKCDTACQNQILMSHVAIESLKPLMFCNNWISMASCLPCKCKTKPKVCPRVQHSSLFRSIKDKYSFKRCTSPNGFSYSPAISFSSEDLQMSLNNCFSNENNNNADSSEEDMEARYVLDSSLVTELMHAFTSSL